MQTVILRDSGAVWHCGNRLKINPKAISGVSPIVRLRTPRRPVAYRGSAYGPSSQRGEPAKMELSPSALVDAASRFRPMICRPFAGNGKTRRIVGSNTEVCLERSFTVVNVKALAIASVLGSLVLAGPASSQATSQTPTTTQTPPTSQAPQTSQTPPTTVGANKASVVVRIHHARHCRRGRCVARHHRYHRPHHYHRYSEFLWSYENCPPYYGHFMPYYGSYMPYHRVDRPCRSRYRPLIRLPTPQGVVFVR